MVVGSQAVARPGERVRATLPHALGNCYCSNMSQLPPAHDPEQLALQVEHARQCLGDQVADMDPGDVILILQALLRPPGSGRRFFLREMRPGVYVP